MTQPVTKLLALTFLFAAISGCGPTQAKIEESVKAEMKAQLNVEVATIELKKQDNGGYLGTATATNGDVYDVVVEPPKNNQVQWRAVTSQSTLEKQSRQTLEESLKSKVKSLTLNKQSDTAYDGKAEMENGFIFDLKLTLQGAAFHLEWLPAAK